MTEKAEPEYLIDNNKVKVGDWKMGPRTSIGHHVHAMDYLVVYLSDGELTVASDGENLTFPMEVGATVFGNTGDTHDVLNLGDKAIRFLEIELK